MHTKKSSDVGIELRIALLPSSYTPDVGGVEVLTANLARHLHDRGHEVEVWTARTAGDELPVREAIDGILVRRFVFALPRAHPRSLFSFPPAALATLRELRVLAHDLTPDVLHVQCFSGNGAYAAALSRMTGIPLLVTLQGETVMDDHNIYEDSVTLRTSLRLGLRRAAAVTGCSAFTLRDAERRFGLDMRKAQVIFNGVEEHEAPPEPIDLPLQRYVLGLGRVVRVKGFDLLLEAFAILAPDQPDLGLVIAGDGSEREPLQQRVLQLGLGERVHFPGRLERGEVTAVMKGAEAFVMPSRVEPFGIVALEAWRAGVPIVVTPHGGAPEFVEAGVSGLVADPFDAMEFAAALATLVRDSALRRKLAEAGRTSVDRFAWSHVTGSYEALYERISLRN
jgi:glycogen synthase